LKNKVQLIKGGLCGVFIASVVNIWIILMLFFDMSEFSFYLFPFLAGVISLMLLADNTFKKYFIALGISIILFLFIEILVGVSGIYLYFFQLRYGTDYLPGAGEGFGMMVSYMFCLSGSSIGTLTALVVTAVKRRCHRFNNTELK